MLFALEGWRTARDDQLHRVQVSADRVQLLRQILEHRYGRPPSNRELQGKLRAYIDEEVLYREALRLELYRSDEVVRRRLAQTMAFIIEGKADLESPDDSELEAIYQRQ